MRIQVFKDLVVWQKALEFFRLIVSDAEKFPTTLAAETVTGQLIRAVGSINANIAEGFGRRSPREFGYRLGVAKGEASKSQDWYIKCGKVNFLDETPVNERIALLEEIIKMLNSLISKVTNHS